MQSYSIGTPGQAWNDEHKQQWRDAQSIERSYADEVLAKLPNNLKGFSVIQYGALPYDENRYPLYAVVSEKISLSKPTVLITGGVHGYETSGVHGALQFINNEMALYAARYNFIVVPCISPWGYETINRWDPMAIDPNRSFYANSPAPEAAQIMAFVASLNTPVLVHVDLHETTDTDNSEFRPALAAREGTVNHNWNIPDGFYTVADTTRPQLEFQKAVVQAVSQVTHIAPADNDGRLIGEPVQSEGIICYDKKALHLCGGMTEATYVTTTEVYPDSPNATAQICNQAQVAAICGALDFVLAANI